MKKVENAKKGAIAAHSRTKHTTLELSKERLFAGLVTQGISEIFYAASGSLNSKHEYEGAIAYAKKRKKEMIRK